MASIVTRADFQSFLLDSSSDDSRSDSMRPLMDAIAETRRSPSSTNTRQGWRFFDEGDRIPASSIPSRSSSDT